MSVILSEIATAYKKIVLQHGQITHYETVP